jgi:hypothetical protein
MNSSGLLAPSSFASVKKTKVFIMHVFGPNLTNCKIVFSLRVAVYTPYQQFNMIFLIEGILSVNRNAQFQLSTARHPRHLLDNFKHLVMIIIPHFFGCIQLLVQIPLVPPHRRMRREEQREGGGSGISKAGYLVLMLVFQQTFLIRLSVYMIEPTSHQKARVA